MTTQQIASQAVLDTIQARKSVRSYTDEPVTPEQVETLLRAAMAAPSGKNVQPWRFVVVTQPETKQKLAVGFNKMIATAPVAIVICGLTANPSGIANNNWTADCAAATENLLLAAESLGLGARRPDAARHRGTRPARRCHALLHRARRTPCRRQQAQKQMESGPYPLRKVVGSATVAGLRVADANSAFLSWTAVKMMSASLIPVILK